MKKAKATAKKSTKKKTVKSKAGKATAKLAKSAGKVFSKVTRKARKLVGSRAPKKRKAAKSLSQNVISLAEIQEKRKQELEFAAAQKPAVPHIPPHELKDKFSVARDRGQARRFRTGLEGIRHK